MNTIYNSFQNGTADINKTPQYTARSAI